MLNNKESILFMISREPHTLFLVEQLAHFTDYLFDGNTYSRTVSSRFYRDLGLELFDFPTSESREVSHQVAS